MTTKQDPEARERLLEWVQPGDKLYTILRHRSRSGMQRVIQVVKLPANDNDSPRYLGDDVATVLGWRYNRDKEGVVVDGCGMDMGFHLVYELSAILFPAYSEGPGRKGGYALKQEWL